MSTCHRVPSTSYQIIGIQGMPVSLLGHVFSFVDEMGIQNLTTTSRYISGITIDKTISDKCNDLRTLIDKIKLKLNGKIHGVQIQFFSLIAVSQVSVKLANLRLLKAHILSIKDQIIDMSMTLGEEEQNSLTDIATPVYFKNIFNVIKIAGNIVNTPLPLVSREYKKLNLEEMFTTKQEQAYVYYDITAAITRKEGPAKAVLIHPHISDELRHGFALRGITKTLMNKGDVSQACEVIQSYGSSYIFTVRATALNAICTDLLQTEDFSKAIELANTIAVPVIQGRTIGAICIAIAKTGDISRASKIVEALPVFNQTITLMEIFKALIMQGNLVGALQVANNISCEDTRNRALSGICMAFAGKGDIPNALKVVHTVSHDVMREFAFCNMCKILAEKGRISEAVEIVTALPGASQGHALWEISNTLAEKGDFEKAIEVASKISNIYRSCAFITLTKSAHTIKEESLLKDTLEKINKLKL